ARSTSGRMLSTAASNAPWSAATTRRRGSLPSGAITLIRAASVSVLMNNLPLGCGARRSRHGGASELGAHLLAERQRQTDRATAAQPAASSARGPSRGAGGGQR